MEKLGIAGFMEDSEWHHNRNEDDPEFDDFKWWDNFNLKVKETFPDGIFTEKTYEKTEESYRELESKLIGEYWQNHPEEFERMTEKIENI